MERLKILSALCLLFIANSPLVMAAQIDAEFDLQYKHTDFTKNKVEFKRTALTFREIFSDRKGDRVILFLRAEGEDNFQSGGLEQAYIQYKGPLGRWNIASGRYLIPFGLLPNYDTEWLLIKAQEDKTIGLRYDSGIKFFGTSDNLDYAFSLSQGVGTRRWRDVDNDKLLSFRLGWEGEDFDDLKIGLSALSGRVLTGKDNNATTDKRLLGIDLIKYQGPFVGRAEFVFGEEKDKMLSGVFLGGDYNLFPRIEINLSHTYFHKKINLNTTTVGLTYKTPLWGLILRMAHRFTYGDEKKNESFVQIYKRFSFSF